MNLTVGIATSGRPELTAALVRRFLQQTRRPDEVVVCPAKDADFDPGAGQGLPYPVRVVRGPQGSCHQRNTIMRETPAADAIIFFDDDFVPADDYLERLEAALEAAPNIVILTGTVIADGVNSAGLSVEQAERLIADDARPGQAAFDETYGGYGCNMAVRMAPVRAHGIAFDEELPLYGWLEDIDFSRQLARHGAIVRTNLCRGVHLGVKKGRTSGVRFGYSQFANPIHMVRKGSMSMRYAAFGMSRNLLANLARSLAPEPWVDRQGRLKGNLRAILDLARGRLHPGKILSLE